LHQIQFGHSFLLYLLEFVVFTVLNIDPIAPSAAKIIGRFSGRKVVPNNVFMPEQTRLPTVHERIHPVKNPPRAEIGTIRKEINITTMNVKHPVKN
jgi:hypothetical protein